MPRSSRRESGGWRPGVCPALVLLGAGCGGGAPVTAVTSAACADPAANVVITDDTNYSLSDEFTIQVQTVKDNTDLVFDWSRLTTDFFGKPVDPAADIDTVLIALWDLTPSQIEAALKVDNLPLGSNAGVITTFPDGTTTSQDLLNFNELGNPLPTDVLWARFNTADPNFQYPQDQFTFMLMASTGTTLGKGARSMSLFTIDPNAAPTELDLTNDSTKLAYTVGLTGARPVRVPAGVASLTLDWSQMTVNAIGNPYVYSQITQAAVAHYTTKSLADLERQFLSLEDIADGWWSGPDPAGPGIAGSSIDLSGLVDASGAAFPGIDSTGIWLAALFCTGCNNPAPWSITILEPCN